MGAPAQARGWLAEPGQERFQTGQGVAGDITCISWNPTQAQPHEGHLACGTWDGEVVVVTVQHNLQLPQKSVAAAEETCPSFKAPAGTQVSSCARARRCSVLTSSTVTAGLPNPVHWVDT